KLIPEVDFLGRPRKNLRESRWVHHYSIKRAQWPTAEVRRDQSAALSRSPQTGPHGFPEGWLLGKQVLQLHPCDFRLDYGRADGPAVAGRSADSQTLWPSAGLKSSGAQAAAWCAVGLHPLHLFLRRLAGGSGNSHGLD